MIARKKQFDNAECWSVERKKEFVNAPHWSIEKMDISSGKRWRTEEKVPILREPELSSSIPVPSNNSRTFRRKCYWSCIARQCTVAERNYRVPLPRRERKRIEVNSESWFDSRRSQAQNRQTFCVLHCCESDGQPRWSRRNPVRLVTSKNRSIQKHLETLLEYSILVLKLAQKRALQFYQTWSNAVILHHTLLAEFIGTAVCMKTKDQLYQRESVFFKTACCS